jgi:hypothetical protein
MGMGFGAKNADPSTVKKDDWNRLRITAWCSNVTINLNGSEVVNVTDSHYLNAGNLGIEVHPGKQFEGMEIRVRDMHLRPLDCK